MKWKSRDSEWTDYYKYTNYSSEGFKHKKQIVSEFLDKINPKIVWDIGSNVDIFSRIAGDKGIQTVSFDNDPVVVEKNYSKGVQRAETKVFPLLFDLMNSSA